MGVFLTGYIRHKTGSWLLVFWFAAALFGLGAVAWWLLATGHKGPLPQFSTTPEPPVLHVPTSINQEPESKSPDIEMHEMQSDLENE